MRHTHVTLILAALLSACTNSGFDDPVLEILPTTSTSAVAPATLSGEQQADSAQHSEPLAVAVEWSEAKALFNVDAVMALMSQDASVSMLAAAHSLKELPDEIRFQRAYGYEFAFDRCQVLTLGTDLESPSSVWCGLEMEHPIARLNGWGPSAFGFQLRILNGDVVSATLSDSGHHHDSVWVPLTDWLDEERPEFDYFDFGQAAAWRTVVSEYLDAHGD